jgi:dynein heavy chain
LCAHVEPLKQALRVEVDAWKQLYGRELNKMYKQKMNEIIAFMNEYSRKLLHPINDLEDVRQAMAALEALRHKQIDIDMNLAPIEVDLSY